MKFFNMIVLLLILVFSTSCGIQSIPTAQNEADAAWAEVMNQYKRRTDLIPNLVSTVKGYATHEEETLEGVIEARAKASQIQIDPSKLNEKSMQEFQNAQGAVTSALGKLMVVVEKYPDLKANQNFLALQSQLEGTENRIAIARRRYIETVKEFNNLVSVFPTSITNSIMFHHEKRPQFTITESEQVAPKVQF